MRRNDARNQNGLSRGWVIALVALALVLGAGIMYVIMNGGFHQDGEEEAVQNTPAEEQTETKQEPAKSDMELYQAASNGGTSIRCEYTEDGYQSVAYLRANGEIRINKTSHRGTDHLVNLLDTKNKAYHWQKGGSQGYEYNSETYAQHFEDDEYDVFKQETFERKANADTIDCEDAGTLDQQLFTKPENIPFTMPTNQI